MNNDNGSNEQQENAEVRHIPIQHLLSILAARDGRLRPSNALAQLLMGSGGSSSGLALLQEDDDDEQEDDEQEWVDEDDDGDVYYPRSRDSIKPLSPHSSPQPAGVELLHSGEFGRVGPKAKARRSPPDVNLAKVIKSRLSKPYTTLYREDLTSNLVPNSNGVITTHYDSNIYTAQYSKDSSFFYTCAQDFRLHIYDTLAPPTPVVPQGRIRDPVDPHLRTTMKLSRRIQGQHGRWTITDANLSPDNQRIVYSSIMSTAYMCSTTEDNPAQIPIPFGDRRQSHDDWYGRSSVAIYSCRFSADGNEIIAGGRGQIFVYDLLANRRSVKIEAHDDDVNSCCWADTSSGNVLVSASDDSFLKVWDRRSLAGSRKPSGVLVGHTEGITYVSAKGDGRYVLSNGKDQSMRLWDLRKMRNSDEVDPHNRYGVRGFDYRYPTRYQPKHQAHPQDCSVMTYRGHQVLMTLIRCHFSPAETTGAQYLYSGSSDGRVHQPVLMSAAWESSRDGCTLARHDWKGLQKMSHSLEDWNEKQRLDNRERDRNSSRYSTRSRMPGSYINELEADDDDDDEDEDYQP
ncbi:hypothetical protein VNI00_002189 [Paramarasmius palmivorus]|uniref:WD40 repeat-like protein n=1 Tax=Paramarasmius palmivorus TaxID=297713 RepID=A0AAW0E119_9AGAR